MNIEKWRDSERALEVRAYITRRFSDWTLKNDEAALRDAAACSVARFERDPGDVAFCLYAVFLYIEARDYSAAANTLSAARRFKSGFKKSGSRTSLTYCFLNALIEHYTGSAKAAQKHADAIMRNVAPREEPFAHMLLAALFYHAGDQEKSFYFYEKSYEMGERSAYIYLGVYRTLRQGINLSGFRPIIINFLNWAAGKKLDVRPFVARYKKNVEGDYSGEPTAYKRLYGLYKEEWTLKAIAASLARRSDVSPEAFMYYSETRRRQLSVPGLNNALVAAAYENGKNVSRRDVERFITENSGNIDVNMRLFLFHSLLGAGDAKGFENDIVFTALYCFENDLFGYYVNSVYAAVLTIDPEKAGEGAEYLKKYSPKIEQIVYDRLFGYRLTVSNPLAVGVWIVEEYKRDAAFYALKNGKASVKATIDGARLIFTEKTGRVTSSAYTLKKLVQNADFPLLSHFYSAKGGAKDGDKGGDADICLALAACFISNENDELELAEDVLSRAINLENVSKKFRREANATLAGVLYRRGKYAAALALYKNVDVGDLDANNIKRALVLYIDAGDIGRAAAFLAETYKKMPERALFHAVKQIAKDERYTPAVAPAARRLLLNGWRDDALINAAINCYNATGDELRELADALPDAPPKELDEKIVAHGALTRRFDAGAQKAFYRLFAGGAANSAAGREFTDYCCYEMLINGVKPEYDVIAALEKLCLGENDHVIAYALCETYITHGLRTLHSDDIISLAVHAAENDGIIPPSFKKSKDKKIMTPYIMKNTPFVYRRDAGGCVKLCFKADDDTEFTAVDMRYFRFGLYYAVIPHFYGEKITYYFMEETPGGSTATKHYFVKNSVPNLNETSDDPFFAVNNALVHAATFKYAQAEQAVELALTRSRKTRGEIL